jgi:hypothetical protein
MKRRRSGRPRGVTAGRSAATRVRRNLASNSEETAATIGETTGVMIVAMIVATTIAARGGGRLELRDRRDHLGAHELDRAHGRQVIHA